MKIEIELSEEEVKDMDGLADYFARKIKSRRVLGVEFSPADKLAGKIFDAYSRIVKGGYNGKR